jgi:hypothetical protein
MAIQFSVTLRNNRVGQIETTVGTSGTLEIRTGAPPANAAAADTGTLLATITLPTDWLTAASAGAVSRNGTWTVAASGAGTAGHFRIKAGATCHLQGDITATGGGGDMTLDNVSIAAGQPVTVNTFSITDANA